VCSKSNFRTKFAPWQELADGLDGFSLGVTIPFPRRELNQLKPFNLAIKGYEGVWK
jgi:hypothetical protein